MSLTNSPSVETVCESNARFCARAWSENPCGGGRNRTRRRLPMHLVREMHRTGMFRMAMPRSWGGPELDFLTQMRRCRSRPGK